jgi:CRISPR-associated protein (TIGR02584 family)
MPAVYLATLGQRPEAVTIAFDLLHAHYHYEALAVLHTDPVHSGIADALADLRRVCAHDYPDGLVHLHPLAFPDGTPIIDIDDQLSAEAYHHAVLNVLYGYHQAGYALHLMVAGGRKAMSIYAMLAASLLFEPPHDRVWTVLSSEALLAQPGQFHIPPGMREQVHMVELPLRPARIAPGTPLDALLERPQGRADAFMKKLTSAERDLVDMLRRHPYATNAQLGSMMNKSDRTIENQLGSIYDKLTGFLERGERVNDKRQLLLDVLRGE